MRPGAGSSKTAPKYLYLPPEAERILGDGSVGLRMDQDPPSLRRTDERSTAYDSPRGEVEHFNFSVLRGTVSWKGKKFFRRSRMAI